MTSVLIVLALVGLAILGAAFAAPHFGRPFDDDINRQLHIRWEQEGVPLPVCSAVLIYAGDAVWWNAATFAVEPASSFPWAGTWALTTAGLAEAFLGIAAEASVAGSTNEILILTDGEYRFYLRTATANVGPLSYIAPADSGANTLMDQAWDVCAAAADACGEVQNYQAAVPAYGRIEARIASILRCTNVNCDVG